MARTQRVPATRRQPPVTTGDARGLSGYRYLLAVALLTLLSSGSMLLLVAAGMSSLGHWPASLPAPVTPDHPVQTSVNGADPFETYLPPLPPRVSEAAVPPPCRVVGVWQIVG